MKVVGIFQPYADEPLAHLRDKDGNKEDDQDGLTPAILHARLEKQSLHKCPVSNFYVFFKSSK